MISEPQERHEFLTMPPPLQRLLALSLLVLLSACDHAVETLPSEAPKRFVYFPPPPPQATHVPEGMAQWLDLLHELQAEIQGLETTLADASAVHHQTSFDDLLHVDLSTLGNDQLAYLWHFADKGYFTLEREVTVKLLEDQALRPATIVAVPTNIAERAQVLAERYADHLQDLRLAIQMYAKTKDVSFHIPNHLDAEQTDILKGMVTEKLSEAATDCATLDARITELKSRRASST